MVTNKRLASDHSNCTWWDPAIFLPCRAIDHIDFVVSCRIRCELGDERSPVTGQAASGSPRCCREKMADLRVRLVSGLGFLSVVFCVILYPLTCISGRPPRCLSPANFPLGCADSSLQLTTHMSSSCSPPRCHPPARRPDVIPLPSGFRVTATKSYQCHRLLQVPVATLITKPFLRVRSPLIASAALQFARARFSRTPVFPYVVFVAPHIFCCLH